MFGQDGTARHRQAAGCLVAGSQSSQLWPLSYAIGRVDKKHLMHLPPPQLLPLQTASRLLQHLHCQKSTGKMISKNQREAQDNQRCHCENHTSSSYIWKTAKPQVKNNVLLDHTFPYNNINTIFRVRFYTNQHFELDTYIRVW